MLRYCGLQLRAAMLILLLAGAGPTAGAATHALPSAPVLPLALAREAADSALAACRARGYRVSVAVVDHAGLVRVLLRADGAGPHTLDSSSRKAYTSLTLGHTTRELVALVQRQPEAAGLADMNERILLLGGGIPVRAGDHLVGAIGVGGAPGGEKDEACARAGLDAIRDQLEAVGAGDDDPD